MCPEPWTGHPLASLPTELLHQTLDQLPGCELLRFIAAFPVAAQRLDGRFWRHRIARDLPYLHELAEQIQPMSADDANDIDWDLLYRRVLNESYPPLGLDAFGTKADLVSIASRRRVWHCAEQLFDAADDVCREKL